MPLDIISIDAELNREINSRLEEYISKDVINHGDVIKDVIEIKPVDLLYRRAFLALLSGLKYPLVVMTGKKRLDNINMESKKKEHYGERVALPVSISYSDHLKLRDLGNLFSDVFVREDRHFEYLLTEFKKLVM